MKGAYPSGGFGVDLPITRPAWDSNPGPPASESRSLPPVAWNESLSCERNDRCLIDAGSAWNGFARNPPSGIQTPGLLMSIIVIAVINIIIFVSSVIINI